MHTQKLESIIEMAAVLARQSDFGEILRLITQKTSALFETDMALIMMVNPATRETIKTVYKVGAQGNNHRYQLIHTYLTGWVIEHNTGFFSADIQNDDRFRQELFHDEPIQSAMCGPLRGGGIIIGTLLLFCKSSGHTFSKNDFSILEQFTAIASPFLQNFQKIQTYFVSPLPKTSLIKKYEGHGLLGKSEPFLTLLQSVEAAAKSDVRVLLEGESGTGKEVLARAIHHCSRRAQEKFIAIDCGAIPRELIESELFGHVKGAFTGAGESRKGLLEEADKGTLFMDEIANLPFEMQSKLLRVLQENEVRPLGSNQVRKVDVRIIAASSQPLRKLVEKEKFREDLFYRLYVYPVDIPALKNRREDIPLLARHFLKKFCKAQGKQINGFSPELMEMLKRHDWKGNVRELENLVERMVALTAPGSKNLNYELLPEEFRKEIPDAFHQEIDEIHEGIVTSPPLPLQESLTKHEKRIVEQALESCHWNQSAAARLLQVSEHTIRYKMKKLGINRP
jgi:transcriptional regulator with GAF, ATPase, and Fis domain